MHACHYHSQSVRPPSSFRCSFFLGWFGVSLFRRELSPKRVIPVLPAMPPNRSVEGAFWSGSHPRLTAVPFVMGFLHSSSLHLHASCFLLLLSVIGKSLNLATNVLTLLPAAISSLTKLKTLRLDSNKLEVCTG